MEVKSFFFLRSKFDVRKTCFLHRLSSCLNSTKISLIFASTTYIFKKNAIIQRGLKLRKITELALHTLVANQQRRTFRSLETSFLLLSKEQHNLSLRFLLFFPKMSEIFFEFLVNFYGHEPMQEKSADIILPLFSTNC